MMAHPTQTTEDEIMEECGNWIKGDEEDEEKAWQASCSERSVQPARKKTPRLKLTKEIPSSPSAGNRQEERNKNILLVQQSEQIKTAQTVHHNNHNHCFIKSNGKVLGEQQAANDIIIKRQQEQNTIVNQLRRMIINRALQAVSSQICLD
jgi:hypothetical protein